jgi:FkbM family methyltransferase
VAVGDAPCKVQIFVTPNSTGGSFISDHAEVPVPDFFDDEYKAMSGLEEVDLITIDSLNLPSVGLIKLDIQGSELIALKGAAETIQRCRPVVLIEEKPIGGYEANIAHIAEAAAFLNTLGMIPKDKVGADRTYIYE